DGQVILPGLIDAHIHPLDILDLDVCDISGHPMTLKELTVFVMKCITRYKVSPGSWLRVHQWNFASGNRPTPDIPTIRAALDRAAPKNPVALLGLDGLHNAYNSFALALAKNKDGKTVGITKKTLAQEFSFY